jgi:DNA-binding transcriptional LysR family regulator
MDIDQLIAFERIVREGSFSKAAQALDIGQPAISARVAALETSLGGSLFIRGRRIALTAQGEAFLPFARRTLDVLGEGVEAARLAQAGKRGRVRLGVLGSLAGGLVGPAVARFLRDQPEVDCSLKSGDHEVMIGLLRDGIVDLALIAWPTADPVDPLWTFREPVVLAASPQHPIAARRRGILTADLVAAARPFLRMRWWPRNPPDLIRLWDRSGHLIEVPMDTGRHLAREGVGVGFFSRILISEDLAEGRLVEVAVQDFPQLQRTFALVQLPREHTLPAAARLLAEAIEEEARRFGLQAVKPVS